MLNRLSIIASKLLILFVAIILFSLGCSSNNSYEVKISKVDDQSPARILEVYKDNKKIEFKEIRYTDDVFLCNDLNPTVFYGDVIDENELKIIFEDGEYVIAKVVKGEVNEEK